jgi:CRISPR system Cascade subunit CasC
VPDAVIVKLRTSRPVSFASAYEEPVLAGETTGGYLKGACTRLADYIPEIERAYGLEEGTRTWVLRAGTGTAALEGLGERVTLAGLLDAVAQAAAERVASGG